MIGEREGAPPRPTSSTEKRRDGFQLPLHPRQIGSWVLFIIAILSFAVIEAPVIAQAGSHWIIAAGIVYSLVFSVGLIAFVRVSKSNPMLDPKTGDPEDKDTRYCKTCDDYMPHRTKHCKLCNKCISGFDHHCMYLNTCIGSKNYRDFFVLVSFATLLLAIQLGISLSLYASGDSLQMWCENSYLRSKSVYLTLSVIFNVIVLAGFGAVASLLVFHIFISFKGMTTYEWIIDVREKEDKKALEAQKKKLESPEYIKRQEDAKQEWLRQREEEKKRKLEAEEKRLKSQLIIRKEVELEVIPDSTLVNLSTIPTSAVEEIAVAPPSSFSEMEVSSDLVRRVSDALGVADLESVGSGAQFSSS
jgi:FtsZ-interacting cell division protein YlmF